MAPVDEDRQLDGLGPPKLDERLHGGAGSAPVVDHVVDQHHRPVRHIGDAGGRPAGLRGPTVIAVTGGVDHSHRHLHAFQPGDLRGDAARQDVAVRDHAHHHQAFDAVVPLHDLVGDAREGAADGVRVHHRGLEETAAQHARRDREA